MSERTIERLYKEIKRQWKKTDADFAAMFGLKNPRSITTSSAGIRYKQGIVMLVRLLDFQRPWFFCEKCGYYSTDSEIEEKGDTNGISCVKCGHQIHY